MTRRGVETCLVVGAAGQIGHQLTLALGEPTLKTSRFDRGPGWWRVDLAEVANQPKLAEELIGKHNISAIYCVGGATDVEGCENDPAATMDVNCHGPLALVGAAKHIPFVYFSTEYVFNGDAGPYDEGSIPDPISSYGRSKYLAEQRILEVHPHPLVLRTTVVYGPDPGEKNFLYALRRTLGAGRTMRVPIDQVSTPTYNQDLAIASLALVEKKTQGIFHVCGPELLSRYDFAVRAARAMGLDPALIAGVTTTELHQKAPRPLHAGLLTEKLRMQLPGVQMRTMEPAIQEWRAQEFVR